MVEQGVLALIGLGVGLGLRHGIDWDHIAAITDITASVVTSEETEQTVYSASGGAAVAVVAHGNKLKEGWAGLFLATFYALGHAIVVAILGILAIWASAILPEWIDPLMERVVGVTLLLLGLWIFYSLWRYGSSFRLRSRWMVVFSLVGRLWAMARSKITGHPLEHTHQVTQYGPKTALGIGMIHGVGAETGSQALLLAAVAGATTAGSSTLMLASFVVGLIISNTLIAVLSTFGFVSSSTRRNMYVGIGMVAGVFSLAVGTMFVFGQGGELPDLQQVLNALFGSAEAAG